MTLVIRVALLGVLPWLQLGTTDCWAAQDQRMLNNRGWSTCGHFGADRLHWLLARRDIVIILCCWALMRDRMKFVQLIGACWGLDDLVASGLSSIIDFSLLHDSVCHFSIIVDAHHLNKDFLRILQSFEEGWIRNLKLGLLPTLEWACLNFSFWVDKCDYTWLAGNNELTLVGEDNLDHFVTVTQQDGFLCPLPLLYIR